MYPQLVLERDDCFSSYGTIKNPERLKMIQEHCTHDIVSEQEGLYEIPEYVCMLCRKHFGGHPSKGDVPEGTYVVPHKFLSQKNQLYIYLIKYFALKYSNLRYVDIVSIIKALEPALLAFDDAIMEVDNDFQKKIRLKKIETK